MSGPPPRRSARIARVNDKLGEESETEDFPTIRRSRRISKRDGEGNGSEEEEEEEEEEENILMIEKDFEDLKTLVEQDMIKTIEKAKKQKKSVNLIAKPFRNYLTLDCRTSIGNFIEWKTFWITDRDDMGEIFQYLACVPYAKLRLVITDRGVTNCVGDIIKKNFESLCELEIFLLDEIEFYQKNNLVSSFANNNYLRHVVMKECGLGEKTFYSLGLVLGYGENLLSKFVLNGNHLDESSCSGFRSWIKQTKRLSILSISGSLIPPLGGYIIGDSLGGNTSMRTLDIKDNPIGCLGMKGICNGLKTNSTLVKLRVSGCLVKSIGGFLLAECIKTNKTLQVVDAAANNFGDDAGAEILNNLCGNLSLTDLDLSDCDFSKNTAKSLSKMLEKNHSLKKLSLHSNNFHQSGKDIPLGLGENIGLESIDLSMSFSDNVIDQFTENYKPNPQQKLRIFFLRGTSRITEGFIQTITKSPSLQNICFSYHFQTLSFPTCNCLENIVHLDLSASTIDISGLLRLCFKNLKHLDLEDCNYYLGQVEYLQVHNDLVEIFPKLESLNLSRSHSTYIEPSMEMLLEVVLRALDNEKFMLKRLSLKNFRGDIGKLGKVLEKNTNLEYLNLNHTLLSHPFKLTKNTTLNTLHIAHFKCDEFPEIANQIVSTDSGLLHIDFSFDELSFQNIQNLISNALKNNKNKINSISFQGNYLSNDQIASLAKKYKFSKINFNFL